MRLERSQEVIIAHGIGIGGTTTLATGNAVRCDETLKALGIDLDAQFEALYKELPITTEHQKRWNSATRKMFEVFQNMGLDPVVMPKLLNAEDCVNCGHCAIGCPADAKWDTRVMVDEAVRKGAELVTDCKVTKLLISGNEVTGVEARHHGKKTVWHADLVILAAGGLDTPVILENSGIPCPQTLFVDMVLCVAGQLPGFKQDRQLLMPFLSEQDGYILSPYMDYLSFFFKKNWRHPMEDIVSIMIKLADEETGGVSGKRKINKVMTETDRRNMKRAVSQCRDILVQMGVPKKEQFNIGKNESSERRASGRDAAADCRGKGYPAQSGPPGQPLRGGRHHPSGSSGKAADADHHGPGGEDRGDAVSQKNCYESRD